MGETSAAAAFERLNHDFYTADPDDYFHMRWYALLLLAAKPEATLGLLADGVTYEHVHARLETPDIDPNGVRDYVSIESQVLLHQTVETLLRLFLAHAGRPACPWLEVAGEMNFRTFKARVQGEILDADVSEDVDDLLLAGACASVPSDAAQRPELEKGRSVLAQLLRIFARRWLDEAHAYNSLKHGLAVTPGAAVLSFIVDGEAVPSPVLLGAGPSLEFLECTPWKDSRRTWNRTTIWIDASEALAYTELARTMIGSLWAIARWRYAKTDMPTEVFCPSELDPLSLRSSGRAPGRHATFPTGLDETKP